MKQPFYADPRLQAGLFWLALSGLLLYLWSGSGYTLYLAFTGQAPLDLRVFGILASLIFTGLLAFITHELANWLVSQFTLPANTLAEREEAAAHFSRHSSGGAVPAISIRRGQQIASKEEQALDTLTGGVILIDTVSGVVLRTDTHLTRAHGPGVVFVQPGERIAEVLDLRKQARRLDKVKALTRDGIELLVDISITFMLDSGEPQPLRNVPNPNLPPFVFSEEHALKVAYGRSYRDGQRGEWAELPALLAADVWRELLIQRDFESLFSDSTDGLPLLESLRYELEIRLMRGSGREARLLVERGLRVLNIGLTNLVMPDEVQKKKLENWKEDWQSKAGEIPDDKDKSLKRLRQQGQNEARKRSLEILTKYLREQLSHGRQPDAADIVREITTATRELFNDSSVQNQQSILDLRSQIDNLIIWAQKQTSAPRDPDDKG